MELPDKAAAVGRMQRFILSHIDEDITLDDLAMAAGYSKYYSVRIFRELLHRTPLEYVRALRLTRAARSLRDGKVVDVALAHGFESHDGFTRAFAREFGIAPRAYQLETPAIGWLVYHPVEAYYQLKEDRRTMENMEKERVSRTVTVTVAERPARKLILKRTLRSSDYWTMCEEIGCDWEGILGSIPEKLDEWCYCQLPPNLMTPGTSSAASGIEVPADYAKPIPEGCDVIELEPCFMLYFQGAPFENPDDFGIAHEIVSEAYAAYRPELYGWCYAPELAPEIMFNADNKVGVRAARPVRKM